MATQIVMMMREHTHTHTHTSVTFLSYFTASKCSCLLKVDNPLCDHTITTLIITVKTTKFCYLLKQNVLTHVGHLQIKYV